MSVIDDITALLTPVLHTNTTKDITAAAVRSALISAFSDIVTDTGTQVSAATTAATAAKALAASEAMGAANFPADILGGAGLYWGQIKFGLQSEGSFEGRGGIREANIDGTNGSEAAVGSAFDFMSSGFIPVIPGQVMTVGITGTGAGVSVGVNLPFILYDANKTYVSGAYPSVGGEWTHGENFTIPSNVYFLRFSGKMASIDRIQLFPGDIDFSVTPMRHKWHSMASTVAMHRPWVGRQIMLCGDSIGAARTGNSWFSDVCRYHGCKNAINNAMDGGTSVTLMQRWNRPTNFSRVDITSADLVDIDAIVVHTGVNDAYAVGMTVGMVDDAPTAGTFCANMIKFIEMVLGYRPYTKLILATSLGKHYPGGPPSSGSDTRSGYAIRSPWQGPTGSPWDNEATILPYRQAIRDLCAKYHLICWDVGVTSQFSAYTGLALSDDGIHPTYSGRYWHDGNPDHIGRVPQGYGSKLIMGSQLAALLHTIFPADWAGTPLIGESSDTYDTAPF